MIKSIASYYFQKYKYSEIIPNVKDAGFDGIMLKWQDNALGESKYVQLELSNKHNLQIINMHCNYIHCNSLWLKDDDKYESHLIDLVNICYDYNIPVAVIHLSSKMTPPAPSLWGLSKLQKVVSLAESKRIKLAFENLRMPVFNRYVFDNIDSPVVGMCFDAGHDHVYCPRYDVIEYLDKPIFTTHLHDNDGLTDQHLIPTTGTGNWQEIIKRLHRYGIKEINLECGNRMLGDISLKQSLDKNYQVACQLEEMLKQQYQSDTNLTSDTIITKK